MLEKFRESKQAEIDRLIKLERKSALPEPYKGARASFTGSLKARGKNGGAVIAEYKRASPSAGNINISLEPEKAAELYAAGGAGAISVLTEETYFKGHLKFLERMTKPGLPLLRKDFIFHSLQVRLTAATPASAMLVIVRTVDDATLTALISECARYGLEAVVEIFNEADLQRARAANAAIIQVNSRDLDTLVVDHTLTKGLIAGKRPGEFWICASGINTARDLREKLALGYDAALVGSSLMASANPGDALRALRAPSPADGV